MSIDAAQAARTPDAVAVVYEGRRLTYRAINEAANRLAHWLIEQGIGSEDRIAVLLDKSPDLATPSAVTTSSGDLSSSTATRSSLPMPCSISQCARRFAAWLMAR